MTEITLAPDPALERGPTLALAYNHQQYISRIRKVNMKRSTRGYLWAMIACLSVMHGVALAQTNDHSQNLSICMNDLGICDHSMLSAAEELQVAAGVSAMLLTAEGVLHPVIARN